LEKYRKDRGMPWVKGINTSGGILKNSTPEGEGEKERQREIDTCDAYSPFQ
jgi:hypothetical protein